MMLLLCLLLCYHQKETKLPSKEIVNNSPQKFTKVKHSPWTVNSSLKLRPSSTNMTASKTANPFSNLAVVGPDMLSVSPLPVSISSTSTNQSRARFSTVLSCNQPCTKSNYLLHVFH